MKFNRKTTKHQRNKINMFFHLKLLFNLLLNPLRDMCEFDLAITKLGSCRNKEQRSSTKTIPEGWITNISFFNNQLLAKTNTDRVQHVKHCYYPSIHHTETLNFRCISKFKSLVITRVDINQYIILPAQSREQGLSVVGEGSWISGTQQ